MCFIQLPVGTSVLILAGVQLILPVWLFYPETNGLSLEEIDRLFVKDGESVDALAEASETCAGSTDW